MNEERRITKHLRYEFTEIEDKKNSKELARNNRSLEEADLKRKQVMADLKADAERIASEIAKLSRWVNDGYDFRETECKVILNDPKNGIKSIYRLDTGELVEQIAMEAHELQENLDLQEEESDDEGEDDYEEDLSGKKRPY